MAEEENEVVHTEKKSSPITKIILFGVPAFIIQLIVVYFITANILINKVGGNEIFLEETETDEEVIEEENDNIESIGAIGQFIYTVNDIIVNPANSKGEKLLLTSLAFDVQSEENKIELKNKEVLVKDMILSILASKNTRMLSNINLRDSLRTEISSKIENFLPGVSINKVYFSKYILN